MPRYLVVLLLACLCLPLPAVMDSPLRTGFARLNYDGGGDWYNDPEVLPNLAIYLNSAVNTTFPTEQSVVKASESKLFEYPFVYLTGHGNIRFTDREVQNLRDWMERGGFLYADDDYGMDESFRREIKRIFPERELVELDGSFPLFTCFYDFSAGLPKIHKHDEKRPQAFGIFDDNGRLMTFYTYESNISDGWADPQTHKDPQELRETALKFGVNIVYYLLTRQK
ncbi:MAG TPA: DUF4159 domain-containing protein [Candidatus Cloacimonadota bacterium]|nr:DUF4159 domain-containing protein [Candidatus Cloacimonadota bacterium]